MAGNQVQVDLAALQALTNFTDNSQREQDSARTGSTQRSSGLVQEGLAGRVQHTAEAAVQAGSDHWGQVRGGNEALVTNNIQAGRAYNDGLDSADSAMNKQSYGTSSVINP
jgi:hypothetical protein